jgi:hypothetical protein
MDGSSQCGAISTGLTQTPFFLALALGDHAYARLSSPDAYLGEFTYASFGDIAAGRRAGRRSQALICLVLLQTIWATPHQSNQSADDAHYRIEPLRHGRSPFVICCV